MNRLTEPQQVDKYSLWVVPPVGSEAHQRLQPLVEQIAEAYSAPPFDFHLTAVANILVTPDELGTLKSRAAYLAGQITRFEITLDEYGYSDEPYRSLYVKAHSEQLDGFYATIQDVFPQVANEHFRSNPHGSVGYNIATTAEKLEIIRRNPLPPLSFEATHLDLYVTNGSPENWQKVDAFPLAT